MSENIIRLGDTVNITSGYALKSSLFNSSGKYPVVRIRDVDRGFSETYYINEFNDKKYFVYNGDILISMDGEFRVRKWNGGKAILNQRVCRIEPMNNILNDSYLLHLLPNQLKYIEDHTPFVTVKHLSIKDINEIKIPLPILAEQKRITTILDKADDLRQKRKEASHLLDEFLRSVFLDMFGEPVVNAKLWHIEKFSNVGVLARGKSKHRPRNASELLGGPYPLIQTGEIANANRYIKTFSQTYSEIGLKQSKMWPAGTLCITIAANIAKTAILTFDACFPDSVVGFKPNDKIRIEFVQFWLSFLQKILEEKAPESAQKNINLQILSNLDIPVPSLKLQDMFTEIVKKTDLLIEKYNESEMLLENQFKSLAQSAFRGELEQ